MGIPGADRCQSEVFTPRGQGFSFRSGQTEMACGVSVWTVVVPDGARQATVSFQAQRDVQPGVSGGPMQAVQEFAVYTKTWELIGKQTVFPPDKTGHMDRSFDQTFPLPDQSDHVHLVWVFDDQGAFSASGIAAPAGGTFIANVDDVAFVVDNVPLATSQSASVADARDEAVITFQLPAKWFDRALAPSIEVFVTVQGAYDDHRVTLPSGQEMTAKQLRVEPQEGTDNESSPSYTMLLPPSFIKAAGAGEYTIRLAPASSATVASGDSLPAAAWTLIPIVVAVFATAALTLRPRQEGKNAGVQALLPWSGLFVVTLALVWLAIVVGPGRLFSWSLGPDVWGPAALLLAWTFAGTAIIVHRLWHGSKDQMSAQKSLTEQRDAEKTARIDAQEALYTLAHDMKAPVVTLDYLIDELAAARTGEIDDRDHQVSLGRTRQVICEMDKRITAMMDFARGADQLQEPGEVHVRTAVEQSAQMLKPHSEKKGTRLEIEPGPDAWLSISQDSFDHVITNLVDNAIKYGPEKDGIVRVRWRDRGRSKRTGGLVLEVADNGSGIARQDRDRIFKLLTRLPDPTGRNLPGTGVGLAVVRRIVASQQGRIEVAHAPEGGTLMRVIWPPSRVLRVQPQSAVLATPQGAPAAPAADGAALHNRDPMAPSPQEAPASGPGPKDRPGSPSPVTA